MQFSWLVFYCFQYKYTANGMQQHLTYSEIAICLYHAECINMRQYSHMHMHIQNASTVYCPRVCFSQLWYFVVLITINAQLYSYPNKSSSISSICEINNKIKFAICGNMRKCNIKIKLSLLCVLSFSIY